MKRLLPLFGFLLLSLQAGVAQAVTFTPNYIASHMADPASVNAIMHATKLFDNNDIEGVERYLQSQPPLLREEALTVLARRALDFSVMTPEREKFLVTISREEPKFMVKSQGNGYWATMPAFNFAGEAKWVLNRWKVKLMQDEALRLLNYDQLNLSKWLSFTAPDYTLRREALVTLVPDLKKPNLDKLVALYLADPNMVWSPDNALLARLAEASGDTKVYDLLWLRRTDSYSLTALQKLELAPISPQDISLMIGATINPVLKEPALRQLADMHPLTDDVKAFLLKQMGDRQGGERVAVWVAKNGNGAWLRDVEKSASGVTYRNIKSGLQAIEH